MAAAQFLPEVGEIAALEALRVSAKAVELLTARRWYVIQSAREAGVTSAQIGEALVTGPEPFPTLPYSASFYRISRFCQSTNGSKSSSENARLPTYWVLSKVQDVRQHRFGN